MNGEFQFRELDDNIENDINDLDVDIYYFAYNLLVKSLDKTNLNDAIVNIVNITKRLYNCSNVVFFKKDELNHYDYYLKDTNLKEQDKYIIYSLVNKAKNIIENNTIYEFKHRVSDSIENVSFVPISSGENEYIAALTNFNVEKTEHNKKYFKIITETISFILKEKELIDKLTKTSTIDSLTDLNNRNSYERDLDKYDSKEATLSFAIFDLFRLKHINDNYGHTYGDDYIKKTAAILQNYFPEYNITYNQDGTTRKEHTGNHLYRIGGDEFVLIATTENSQMLYAKAELIKEEVRLMDLGIEDKPIIGVNYGISQRLNNESIKELYMQADDNLKLDKTNTYKDLGIDRRR